LLFPEKSAWSNKCS